MNDKNCKATVNWYKACAEIANQLNGTKRETYSSALIENIKTSSDNYFRNSKRPLSTLSLIQRELSGVVEKLLFPPQLTEKFNLKAAAKCDFSGYNPAQWDIDPDTILKLVWWLGIITTILTMIILIILCLYCIQIRKMKRSSERKKDPCADMADYQCGPPGCDCSRRIWDTGEPRKPSKQRPLPEDDTSDFSESEKEELGLRFTVQSSCHDDSSYTAHKKKSSEQRRHSRTH